MILVSETCNRRFVLCTHLPKFSPSSNVSGSVRSFVSGRGMSKRTAIMGSPPRINSGACSLEFL